MINVYLSIFYYRKQLTNGTKIVSNKIFVSLCIRGKNVKMICVDDGMVIEAGNLVRTGPISMNLDI